MEAVARQVGNLPAAEEERRHERGHEHDLDEVAHHEHQVLRSRVLREVAAHELGLGLGEVEGDALRLGHTGREEDQEGHRLIEDAPRRQPAPHEAALLARHLLEIERVVGEDDPDQCEPHGDLVGDHLRRPADAAQERPAIVRGPAAQHDAVHAEGGHGEHEEDPHVQLRRLQVDGPVADLEDVAERDDGEGEKGGDQAHERRERVQQPIDCGRGDVLLQQELDRVGDERVHQAEAGEAEDRGPIGADPILDDGADLAFEEHPQPDHLQREQDGEERLARRDRDVDRHARGWRDARSARAPGRR